MRGDGIFSDMLWFLVGAGGALGSLLRFFLQGQIQVAAGGRFPWGTLGVNLIGSAAIGALAAWLEKTSLPVQPLRAFLIVGILGGFTTFSSFALENLNLLRAGEGRLALLYLAASNVLGIGAAALCFFAAKAALRD
jgi:CrcB protein